MRLLISLGIGVGMALCLATLADAAETVGPKSKQVDAVVHQVLPKHGPGAAVLVVAKGRIVHAKGYGQADLNTNRPIATDTLFELASVSKQFTAMAIMMLAEEGRLRYTDDIRRHLPEFPQHKPDRPIRIEDLLHHISGIPDYMDVWEGDDQQFARLTDADILKLLAKQRLEFPTGTKYEYSNSNYVLLALIVERVARQPFSQFMTQRILAPLGMKRSRIHDGQGGPLANLAHGYAHHNSGGFTPDSRPNIVYGDGSLFSSIDDLALWDKALRDNRLVTAKTMKRAYTSGRLDNGEKVGYGFGWEDGSGDDHPWMGHGGAWSGYANFLCRYLEDDLTVIVLTNLDGFDAGDLVDKVASVYFQN